MASNVLRLPDVKARTGQSRSTIYARIAEGTFPKQIPLGSARSVGWLESEILAWIAACVAERDAKTSNASLGGGACISDPPTWKEKLRFRAAGGQS